MEDNPVIVSENPAAAELDPTSPEVASQVKQREQAQDEALDVADVPASAKLGSFTFAVNGFSAALTPEQAARVEKTPGVARVVRDRLHQVHTDTSPGFLGLDGQRGAWESGYTGEGVIVGVIDTGIWPEHPSFADDGSYPEPPTDWMGGSVACDFGDTAHNPEDLPFDCNNKLIGARDMRTQYKRFFGPEVYNSARDYDGHGTHTASTAAGNRAVAAEIFDMPRGNISGIAPRAHVATYSACGSAGCFGGDLADAIDAAVADGVDVINFSIGGSPDLAGADDLAFLSANDAGVFSAASAGNNGPGAGTIGSPANDPWLLGVGANTHTRTFQTTVTLGSGDQFTGASVTEGTGGEVPLVDAADHGNELCIPAFGFDPPITGAIVLCDPGFGGASTNQSRAVSEHGGRGTVVFDQNDAQSLDTVNHWTPTAHVSFSDGRAIKSYIDAAGADATASIGTGDDARIQGSVMANTSSRGPTVVAESVIKPDVTAPGVNVLAGASPTPLRGRPGQLFQAISGTSMSSPHVAGVLALIKQAHPDWTSAMAQSAVMTTARNDVFKEDGETAADPFDMGSGHLDPGRVADRENSVFDPGLVYNAGFDDYRGFLCDAAPEAIADPQGTCAALEDAGVPTDQEDLNYPSVGAAEVAREIVQRTITSVADRTVTWSATVDEPEGFDVEVSPQVVELAPGESADVTIEITKRTAPVDEWRFGELTWRGDGYEVASPIAVNGVRFAAPASISGTGTDGDASFEIQFGYSGDYTAAAHGLAQVTPLAGSVEQDPDQFFTPEDPTGTTAHGITVSGTNHLRIELGTANLTPSDPDTDLDLYLFNSQGERVALSAAAGTDEHIDLRRPADGAYTLYVHGWRVGDTPVQYEVQLWQVPSESDTGPLQIVSAPAAANSGELGTVDLAWSGLDAGSAYLGAVSHAGPDGLLDLTLVEVTTG